MTVWVTRKLVEAIHDIQLAEHGGASGVRDEGLLESALARPLNRASYEEPDVVELGALYGLAIARNHPFVDGNKRTSWATLATFLVLNGVQITASEAEVVVAMQEMAAGELSDDEFTLWLREHTAVAG